MQRFMESMRLTSPLWCALAFFAVNPTVRAEQPSPEKQLVRSVRVTYTDLDLSRETDVEILLARIEQAAYRACGGNPRRHPSYDVMPNRTEEVFKECREDAVARAVGEIDAPVLALARVQSVGK